MIANGSPQMHAIAAIRNIFDKLFPLFMMPPPQVRSGKPRFRCSSGQRKTFAHSCNLIESWDSVSGGHLSMMSADIAVDIGKAELSDEEVVRRIIEGERALFE